MYQNNVLHVVDCVSGVTSKCQKYRLKMHSQPQWESLPLVALVNVLKHLTLKDVLCATSSCVAWRVALPYFKPKREQIKLIVNEDENDRNAFITLMFRKNVRSLIIELDCTSDEEVDKFAKNFLYRYLDSRLISELVFIATSNYLKYEESTPIEKIRSSLTEPIVQSLLRYDLRKITLHGCGALLPNKFDTPNPLSSSELYQIWATNVRYTPKLVNPLIAYDCRNLAVLALDYNFLDNNFIDSLSQSLCLQKLVLNISYVPEDGFERFVWGRRRYRGLRQNKYEVVINVINLTPNELDEVRSSVLAPGIPLSTFRVLFCNTMKKSLVFEVVDLYRETLKEVCWIDAEVERPVYSSRSCMVMDEEHEDSIEINDNSTYDSVNPFILMCWRCTKLQKLVIHGHCNSALDLLGMARLRSSTLNVLEVSSINLEHFTYIDFIREMALSLKMSWKPCNISTVGQALSSEGTLEQRQDYILQITRPEICQALPDIT